MTKVNYLTRTNTPTTFWRLLDGEIVACDAGEAGSQVSHLLLQVSGVHGNLDPAELMANTLLEGKTDPKAWQLTPTKSLYYLVRPAIPRRLRVLIRGGVARRQKSPIHWPIEERYVRLQFALVRAQLEKKGVEALPFIHFWPHGKRFALVLTHDVESAAGQRFVRELADLEEEKGFRSSFNFVANSYAVDRHLLDELRARGFEIGVHGLKHDGLLFSSRAVFEKRAEMINHYLREWGAVGFRSPMTHRIPEWMQALDVEYDSSFFDTDPFEPMPGGTMSIWPFFLGRFVELPYTLVQDHTLMITLGERSPRMWLEKVDFIRRHSGMALSLTHPDYLLEPGRLAVYEQFLRAMKERDDYWHALPKAVASWWRARTRAASAHELPGASLGEIRLVDGQLFLVPDAGASGA